MERIKVIHDTIGNTLTVWLGTPQAEYVSTLTDDEVVVMKDRVGRVLGVEVLHCRPVEPDGRLSLEVSIPPALPPG